MSQSVPKIGREQLKVLQVLWQRGEATARDVADELNKERFVAHSTVQTVLRKLEGKGVIGHKKKDRTFIYYPTSEQEDVKFTTLHDLVDRMYGGSVSAAFAHLLQKDAIDPEEIKKIKQLLNKR